MDGIVAAAWVPGVVGELPSWVASFDAVAAGEAGSFDVAAVVVAAAVDTFAGAVAAAVVAAADGLVEEHVAEALAFGVAVVAVEGKAARPAWAQPQLQVVPMICSNCTSS